MFRNSDSSNRGEPEKVRSKDYRLRSALCIPIGQREMGFMFKDEVSAGQFQRDVHAAQYSSWRRF